MNTLTTKQIDLMNRLIKENHSLQINKTTSRTVDYNSAGWGDDIDYYNLKPTSDENIEDIKTYYTNNRLPILKQMLFNDKEFISIVKVLEYKQNNNITGNKITINYTNLKDNGKTWVESKETIYRTK